MSVRQAREAAAAINMQDQSYLFVKLPILHGVTYPQPFVKQQQLLKLPLAPPPKFGDLG